VEASGVRRRCFLLSALRRLFLPSFFAAHRQIDEAPQKGRQNAPGRVVGRALLIGSDAPADMGHRGRQLFEQTLGGVVGRRNPAGFPYALRPRRRREDGFSGREQPDGPHRRGEPPDGRAEENA